MCVRAGVHASVCIHADEICFSNFGTFSVFPKECLYMCAYMHACMHTYIHAYVYIKAIIVNINIKHSIYNIIHTLQMTNNTR